MKVPSSYLGRAETSHLFLHLDSLDEALLRIDSIANLLADELPRHPTERLSIRIACRTAVWPSATLEPVLRRIWGDAAVGAFELAPLRRRDVVAAAEATGINADIFFRELYSANVVPFAIKPLTLKLLLALFRKDGALPHSVAEIYYQGCLKLCEEQSPTRRDAQRFGAFTVAQRLRAASRIAAATMFANRYAVWTGPKGDGIPNEDLPLSDLVGSHERGDFPSFEITEQCVREVLDSGLFTSRGPNRLGWAHQGYAEFLAASYLKAKEVHAQGILKMLLHPSGGLVPQLNAVTAWVASNSKEVRERLMQHDPMALLQGDLTHWDASDIAMLTAALFAALNENCAYDLTVGISTFYQRLNHPGLPSQLRPYILADSKNVVTRRTAITIAERCKLRDLQPELLTLALDVNADPHLRSRAVAALSTCGDDTATSQLLPLAKGELDPDPHDEMKGYALEILWPDHIKANELFTILTPPDEGFVGAYVMFLTRTLPETLKPDDLPIALQWATSLVTDAQELGDYHRISLADCILIRAWRNLGRTEIADALLTYIFARLRSHHNLFGGTSLRETDAFHAELESNFAPRKAFLLAAARLPLSTTDTYHLMRTRILRHADLQWLLDVSPGAPKYDASLDAESVCNMVRDVAVLDNPKDFAVVYDTALKWPALWQALKNAFEGIPLASEAARSLRHSHEMMERLKVDQVSKVTPSPVERIANELAKFDAGEWAAWWRLNLELTLTPNSRTYGSEWDYFISEMPGWQSADGTTRQRILAAANEYLRVAETSISKWIGKNPLTLYRNDAAAFRALLLLKEFDEPSYQTIPPQTWAKWAPVVVALPRPSGSEKAAFLNELLTDALAAAPIEFVAAVREIMREE